VLPLVAQVRIYLHTSNDTTGAGNRELVPTSYSLAIDCAMESMAPTSRAIWQRTHGVQQREQTRSPQNDPSIDFVSRTLVRTWARQIQSRIGTNRARPHRMQLSPTFSAVRPNTMHGQNRVQSRTLQSAQQPNRSACQSDIFDVQMISA